MLCRGRRAGNFSTASPPASNCATRLRCGLYARHDSKPPPERSPPAGATVPQNSQKNAQTSSHGQHTTNRVYCRNTLCWPRRKPFRPGLTSNFEKFRKRKVQMKVTVPCVRLSAIAILLGLLVSMIAISAQAQLPLVKLSNDG